MDGDDLAANMARALMAQIEHTVTTLASTPVVVEEPERTETPDVEDDEKEEVIDYVPWVRPAHHKCISMDSLDKFDVATGHKYGARLEQEFCEWSDAGRPDVKNWMQRVVTKQLEEPVEDDDETRREAMLSECSEMVRKLTFTTPFESIELDIAYGNKLFAEWEWMIQEKAKAPYTELLDEINNYMAGVKPVSDLQNVRIEMARLFAAYECMLVSNDDSDEDSEDDCPSFSPFNRPPLQKLINIWYGPNGRRTDEEIEAELAVAQERQRVHEALLAF
jgi:hypothetical protein